MVFQRQEFRDSKVQIISRSAHSIVKEKSQLNVIGVGSGAGKSMSQTLSPFPHTRHTSSAVRSIKGNMPQKNKEET